MLLNTREVQEALIRISDEFKSAVDEVQQLKPSEVDKEVRTLVADELSKLISGVTYCTFSLEVSSDIGYTNKAIRKGVKGLKMSDGVRYILLKLLDKTTQMSETLLEFSNLEAEFYDRILY